MNLSPVLSVFLTIVSANAGDQNALNLVQDVPSRYLRQAGDEGRRVVTHMSADVGERKSGSSLTETDLLGRDGGRILWSRRWSGWWRYRSSPNRTPTPSPTTRPTPSPTNPPTPSPTNPPTPSPTNPPTPSPTNRPTPLPTLPLTPKPNHIPTIGSKKDTNDTKPKAKEDTKPKATVRTMCRNETENGNFFFNCDTTCLSDAVGMKTFEELYSIELLNVTQQFEAENLQLLAHCFQASFNRILSTCSHDDVLVLSKISPVGDFRSAEVQNTISGSDAIRRRLESKVNGYFVLKSTYYCNVCPKVCDDESQAADGCRRLGWDAELQDAIRDDTFLSEFKMQIENLGSPRQSFSEVGQIIPVEHNEPFVTQNLPVCDIKMCCDITQGNWCSEGFIADDVYYPQNCRLSNGCECKCLITCRDTDNCSLEEPTEATAERAPVAPAAETAESAGSASAGGTVATPVAASSPSLSCTASNAVNTIEREYIVELLGVEANLPSQMSNDVAACFQEAFEILLAVCDNNEVSVFSQASPVGGFRYYEESEYSGRRKLPERGQRGYQVVTFDHSCIACSDPLTCDASNCGRRRRLEERNLQSETFFALFEGCLQSKQSNAITPAFDEIGRIIPISSNELFVTDDQTGVCDLPTCCNVAGTAWCTNELVVIESLAAATGGGHVSASASASTSYNPDGTLKSVEVTAIATGEVTTVKIYGPPGCSGTTCDCMCLVECPYPNYCADIVNS